MPNTDNRNTYRETKGAPRRRRRRLTPVQRLARWVHKNAGAIAVTAVLAAGVVMGSVGTGAYLRVTADRTRDYGRELKYASYTVKSGDTMWSISVDMAALNPEFTDVRQYLSLLQKTNHNYGDYLEAGTRILIPYYDGGADMTIMEIYAKYNIAGYDEWLKQAGQ